MLAQAHWSRLSRHVSCTCFMSLSRKCLTCFLPPLKEKTYFAVTLPEVNYNSETGVIVVHPKKRKPFIMRTLPVSTSFAIFEKSVSVYCQ